MYVYGGDNYPTGPNMDTEYRRLPNVPEERIQSPNSDVGYAYAPYNLQQPIYVTGHENMPYASYRNLYPESYVPTYRRMPNAPSAHPPFPHQDAAYGTPYPYPNYYYQPYPNYLYNQWIPVEGANPPYLANGVPNFQMQETAMPYAVEGSPGIPDDGSHFYPEQPYMVPNMYYPMENPCYRVPDYNEMHYPIEASPPVSEAISSDSSTEFSSDESRSVTPEALVFPYCNTPSGFQYYYIPWNCEFNCCVPTYVPQEPIMMPLDGTQDSNEPIPNQYYPQQVGRPSLIQYHTGVVNAESQTKGNVEDDKFEQLPDAEKFANEEARYPDSEVQPHEIELKESEMDDKILVEDQHVCDLGNTKMHGNEILRATDYCKNDLYRELVEEKTQREKHNGGEHNEGAEGNWKGLKRILNSTPHTCDIRAYQQRDLSTDQTSKDNAVGEELLREIEDGETDSDSSVDSEYDHVKDEKQLQSDSLKKDDGEKHENNSHSGGNIIGYCEIGDHGGVTHSITCRREMSNVNSGNSAMKYVVYNAAINEHVSSEFAPLDKGNFSGVKESSFNPEARDVGQNPFSEFPKIEHHLETKQTSTFPQVNRKYVAKQLTEALEKNKFKDTAKGVTKAEENNQDFCKPSHCNQRYIYENGNRYNLSGNSNSRARLASGSKPDYGESVHNVGSSSFGMKTSTPRHQEMNFDSEKRERRRPIGRFNFGHRSGSRSDLQANPESWIANNPRDLGKRNSREEYRGRRTQNQGFSEKANASSQRQGGRRNRQLNMRTVGGSEFVSDINCKATSGGTAKGMSNARSWCYDTHGSKRPTVSSHDWSNKKIEDTACSVKFGQHVRLPNPSNRSTLPQLNQDSLRNFSKCESNDMKDMQRHQVKLPSFECFRSDRNARKLHECSKANVRSQPKSEIRKDVAKPSSEYVNQTLPSHLGKGDDKNESNINAKRIPLYATPHCSRGLLPRSQYLTPFHNPNNTRDATSLLPRKVEKELQFPAITPEKNLSYREKFDRYARVDKSNESLKSEKIRNTMEEKVLDTKISKMDSTINQHSIMLNALIKDLSNKVEDQYNSNGKGRNSQKKVSNNVSQRQEITKDRDDSEEMIGEEESSKTEEKAKEKEAEELGIGNDKDIKLKEMEVDNAAEDQEKSDDQDLKLEEVKYDEAVDGQDADLIDLKINSSPMSQVTGNDKEGKVSEISNDEHLKPEEIGSDEALTSPDDNYVDFGMDSPPWVFVEGEIATQQSSVSEQKYEHLNSTQHLIKIGSPTPDNASDTETIPQSASEPEDKGVFPSSDTTIPKQSASESDENKSISMASDSTVPKLQLCENYTMGNSTEKEAAASKEILNEDSGALAISRIPIHQSAESPFEFVDDDLKEAVLKDIFYFVINGFFNNNRTMIGALEKLFKRIVERKGILITDNKNLLTLIYFKVEEFLDTAIDDQETEKLMQLKTTARSLTIRVDGAQPECSELYKDPNVSIKFPQNPAASMTPTENNCENGLEEEFTACPSERSISHVVSDLCVKEQPNIIEGSSKDEVRESTPYASKSVIHQTEAESVDPRDSEREILLADAIDCNIPEFLGGNVAIVDALLKKLKTIENKANVLSTIDEDLIAMLECRTLYFMAKPGRYPYEIRNMLMDLKSLLRNIRMKVKEARDSRASVNSKVSRGESAAADKNPDLTSPQAAACTTSASLENSIGESSVAPDFEVLRKSTSRKLSLKLSEDADIKLANTILKSNVDEVMKRFFQGDRKMIDLVLLMFEKVKSKEGTLVPEDKDFMKMLDSQIELFLHITDDDAETSKLLKLRNIVRSQESTRKFGERLRKMKEEAVHGTKEHGI